MAGRFRFRLETVERIRRREQDERRRGVALAIQEVQRVKERIGVLTQQLANSIDLKRGLQRAEHVDMRSLRGHQFHLGDLHRRILESGEQLTQRRSVVDQERAKLAEASKRLKVIEKLREKQWNRHVMALRREEQAAMDEAALQKYVRRAAIEDRKIVT